MGRGPTKEYYQLLNESYVEGTLTCLKPEVVEQKITTEFPLVLNIEPTNDCNAKCYYCPREKSAKKRGIHYLSIEDFKSVVDQISKNKLIMLNLHKDGEPLLHKDLPEMVEYIKQKNAAQIIHLNTNGILINSKTGHGIIERGIDDITISIDAAREETYYRLKRVKGLETLEENIKGAIDYREKVSSKTNIRVKIMEFDDIKKEEIEQFHDKWIGIADEIQVTGLHSWSGAVDVKITDEQVSERYPCALLWYMLAVNSNGRVSVCNVDWDYSGVLGDIYGQSINEIWNGKNIREIRKAHLNGKWDCPKVCEECIVWVSVGNVWDYLNSKSEFI